MKYNNLGATGLLVSELCLGAMTFGGRGIWKAIGAQSLEEARKLIEVAVDKGINFFDNANAYSEGLAEEIMGKIVKELPQSNELIIATKLRIRMGEGPNQVGLSRHHIYQEVDNSLRRLQRDRIDMLYVHGVDPITPLEEMMRGLEDVVRSGKVRYLGICNHPAWMVAKANGIAKSNNWTSFSALQYYYSLAGRDIEHSILPYARSEGLSVLPWSPLAGGFLSGKYDRKTNRTGDGRRDEFDFPPVNPTQVYDIIDTLRAVAATKNASVPQIALRWLLEQETIDSVLVGAKSKNQLLDNIACTEIALSEEELQQLSAVSAITTPYPNWMVDFQAGDRFPNEII
ncbi:MAG: aldo/keto reductase [Bacteroidota bacterium]